ncbi:MAG: hypothetical protein ACPHZ5_04565, partial [Candidatus Puniceispirillum sp.]
VPQPLGLTKFYNGKEQKLPLPACETANSVPKSPESPFLGVGRRRKPIICLNFHEICRNRF